MKTPDEIDEALQALEHVQHHDNARDRAGTVLGWVLGDESLDTLLWELGIGPQPKPPTPQEQADRAVYEYLDDLDSRIKAMGGAVPDHVRERFKHHLEQQRPNPSN